MVLSSLCPSVAQVDGLQWERTRLCSAPSAIDRLEVADGFREAAFLGLCV